MKKLISQCCAALLLLFLFSVQAFAQGFSPDSEEKLQAALESFESVPLVGGISAAIMVEDLGLWKGSTGFAARNVDANLIPQPGGAPFLLETPSRMYSVTKIFTAALVLELAAEGKLNLDAPVGNYLPINAINPQLSNAVTIRQLLRHESGFSDYVDEQQFQIAVAFQPERFWSPVEIIYFAKKINEVGAVQSYSSTNYIILGAVVEQVTGKSVATLYRERFFNPLGLKSMYLGAREDKGDRLELAAPHDNLSPFNPIFQLLGRPTFPNQVTNISSFPFTAIVSAAFTGGGLVTDISDLVNWGSAFFGGRATSQQTLETMLNSIGTVPEPDGDLLGYGLIVNKRVSETDYFVGHNGRAPGYKALLVHQPERKITIAILSNDGGIDPYLVAKKLYEALPEIYCGNDFKKVQVCFKGKSLCVAKPAAINLLSKGAYLGNCGMMSGKASRLAGETEETLSLLAYPNPFSNKVTLAFTSPVSGPANLQVFDLEGKVVANLFGGEIEAGKTYKMEMLAGSHKSGFYISRLQTSAGTYHQRIELKP